MWCNFPSIIKDEPLRSFDFNNATTNKNMNHHRKLETLLELMNYYLQARKRNINSKYNMTMFY
jgi:hypothetical protein